MYLFRKWMESLTLTEVVNESNGDRFFAIVSSKISSGKRYIDIKNKCLDMIPNLSE